MHEQLGDVVVLRHNYKVMIANSLTQLFLVSQPPTRSTPCLSMNGDKATRECPLGKDRPPLVLLNGLLYTSPCIFCITKSSANSYAVTESISLFDSPTNE